MKTLIVVIGKAELEVAMFPVRRLLRATRRRWIQGSVMLATVFLVIRNEGLLSMSTGRPGTGVGRSDMAHREGDRRDRDNTQKQVRMEQHFYIPLPDNHYRFFLIITTVD